MKHKITFQYIFSFSAASHHMRSHAECAWEFCCQIMLLLNYGNVIVNVTVIKIIPTKSVCSDTVPKK